MLAALNKAGAEYVLLTISGGKEQLRFARDIMPEFSRAIAGAAARAELSPVGCGFVWLEVPTSGRKLAR
jgi:hypothetical protein